MTSPLGAVRRWMGSTAHLPAELGGAQAVLHEDWHRDGGGYGGHGGHAEHPLRLQFIQVRRQFSSCLIAYMIVPTTHDISSLIPPYNPPYSLIRQSKTLGQREMP